jgi:hypothetical protein
LLDAGAEPASIEYKRLTGECDGRPYVVEAAFGWLGDEYEDDRRLVTGINFSPCLRDLSLLKIFTGLGGTGDFHEPTVPLRSWWRFSLPLD